MKKFITLSVIVLLALNATAQFQKGNKLLGFGLNVVSTNNEIKSPPLSQMVKGTTVGLSVELAFASKENSIKGFFAGGGYNWNKYSSSNQSPSYIENTNFSLAGGYFTRKYRKLGGDFFVFAEGRATVNYLHSKDMVSSDNNTKGIGVNIGLYPGLAYKWTDRFLLELRFADFVNVGYAWQKSKSANGNSSTQNNFNLGTSLGLGYLDNIGIGARWILK